MIKKYAVEDNCWAKLETSIDATATKIRIKETHNLPQSWEWIATLSKKQGDEIIKMEKVLVVKRELNLLTVQRGFQSTAQAWEENDVINLYITAEIIREIQRGFDKKADLIDGKVPASQLPEVSQIDESNLVHKSWDEEIGWHKIFNSTDPIAFKVKPWDYSAVRFKENNNEIGSIQAFSPTRFQNFRKGSLEITGQGNNKITIRPWDRDCMTFTSWWEVEWKWQNRTGWRERYTPTLSWDTWWGATFSDTQGRYKVIGKFCFVQVRGIIWNKGTCGWSFKVSLPKLAIERFSIPLAWWIQSIWGNIWTPKAVPLLYRDQIRLAGVLWGHRDTTRSEISVNDFFVFNWCYEIE